MTKSLLRNLQLTREKQLPMKVLNIQLSKWRYQERRILFILVNLNLLTLQGGLINLKPNTQTTVNNSYPLDTIQAFQIFLGGFLFTDIFTTLKLCNFETLKPSYQTHELYTF